MRTLTALYDVRLQRKLFVTRPLRDHIPNPHFVLTPDGLYAQIILILDDIPRQLSPSRGIAICQVSRVEIRVTRSESCDVPNIVPVPAGPSPEAISWSEAQKARTDACTSAAVTVLNRLLMFYKYGLRYPLIEPFRAIDLLHSSKWLDESGTEIETGLQSFSGTWARPGYLENTLQPHNDEHLQHYLEHDVKPSLAEEILLDALGALEQNNLRRALIEAAICSGVATKQTFTYEYLESIDEDRASVPDLLHRVAKGVFGASFKEAHPERYVHIDYLFRSRNKAAHRAETHYRDDQGPEHTVTRQMASEWLISIQHLLLWLDQFWRVED